MWSWPVEASQNFAAFVSQELRSKVGFNLYNHLDSWSHEQYISYGEVCFMNAAPYTIYALDSIQYLSITCLNPFEKEGFMSEKHCHSYCTSGRTVMPLISAYSRAHDTTKSV